MAGSAGAAAAGRGGVSGSSGSGASAGAGMDGGAGNDGGTGGGTLRFVDASPVTELYTESIEDNPTLTADGLQIFFTSDRASNMDVWVATP